MKQLQHFIRRDIRGKNWQEEDEMEEVLQSPHSTYTDQANAIDKFLNSWGKEKK